MCEMMRYIFGGLQSSEVAVKRIQRILQKQQKFNRHAVLCTCVMVACIVLTELDRQEQNRKIEKLSKDIEELKRSEGE